MDLKSLRLTNMKAGAEDGLEDGQFLAYASTWTRTPDSYGDVVAKGAFKDTLAEWKASGDTLPILFGHRMDDPDYWLGGAVELTEDDHGLLVKGELDLDNPKAKQVYRMLKGRRISQMSFAFDTLEDGIVDLGEEKTARELRKVKLYEISIVPIGANQDTEVLAVKALAASMKAGRVISTKNLESLKSARDTLDSVIKAAEADSTNDSEDEASSGKSQDDEAQARKSTAASSRSALMIQVASAL
jgi:phage prohead protease, HK97 family